MPAKRAVLCGCLFLFLAAPSHAELAIDPPHWVERPLDNRAMALYAVDCPDADRCLAVGDLGTLWSSDDGGEHWSLAPLGTDRALRSLHCADGGPCLAGGERGLLLRSTDRGETWQSVATATTATLTGLACPGADRCLAVGSAGTLLRSDDAGQSWRLDTATTALSLTALDCHGAGICVAVGNEGGVLRSEDAGTRWEQIPVPGSGERQVIWLAVDCDASGLCVMAGMDDPREDTLLMRSADGGRQWAVVTVPPALVSEPDQPDTSWPTAVHCQAGRCLVGANHGQLLVGEDQARQWHWLRAANFLDQLLRDIHCSPDSRCLAVGHDGLILASTDGGESWHTAAEPMGPRTPRGLQCPGGDVCFAATDWDLYRSRDGGWRWQRVLSTHWLAPRTLACADASHCVILSREYRDGTYVVLAHRSADGGDSWQQTEIDFGESGFRSNWRLSCPDVDICYLKGTTLVLRSADGGASWQRRFPADAPILTDIACPSPERCVVTVDDGGLYATVDGGLNWQFQNLPSEQAEIYCGRTDRCLTLTSWTGYPSLLLESDDGLRWRDNPIPLEVPIHAIHCRPGYPCLAGGSGTLWISEDAGQHWQSLPPPPGYDTLSQGQCLDPRHCLLLSRLGQHPERFHSSLTSAGSPTTHVDLRPPVGSLPPGQAVAIGFSVHGVAGDPLGTVTVDAGVASCSAPARRGFCHLTLPAAGEYTLRAYFNPVAPLAPASSPPLSVQVTVPPNNPPIPVTTVGTTVDGDCATLGLADLAGGDGLTSLPEALCVANNTPGADTVSLPAAGRIVLETPHNGWFGANGLPPITGPVTVAGNGAELRRADVAPPFRFFYVAGHPHMDLPRGSLALRDLTLSNGLGRGGAGGFGGGGGGAGMGGAIFNHGALRLERVVLRDNRAEGGRGGDMRPWIQYGGPSGGGGGLDGDGDADGGGFAPATMPPPRLAAGGWAGGGGGSGFGPHQAAGDGLASRPGRGGEGGGDGGWVSFSLGWSFRGNDGTAVGFGGRRLVGGGGPGGGGASGYNGDYRRARGAGGGFGAGAGSDGPGGFGGGDGNSHDGGEGGDGLGGALFNHTGMVYLVDSRITANTVRGGDAGNLLEETSKSRGGDGRGGGLFNLHGRIYLQDSQVLDNLAVAGRGGENQADNYYDDDRDDPPAPSGEIDGDDCASLDASFDGNGLIGADGGEGCRLATRLATLTRLTSASDEPIMSNTGLVFRFTVSADGTPTSGRVVVRDANDTLRCSATLVEGGCRLVFPVPGDHLLRAHYSGGGSYLPSVSAPVQVRVLAPHRPAATTVDFAFEDPNFSWGLDYMHCLPSGHCLVRGTMIHTVGGSRRYGTALARRFPDPIRWELLFMGDLILREIECASPTLCLAVSELDDPDRILISRDFGASWQESLRVPLRWGTEQLSCPTPARCLVVSQGSAEPPLPPQIWGLNAGGMGWELVATLDRLSEASELHCVSADRCLLRAFGDSAGHRLLLSEDGGHSWEVVLAGFTAWPTSLHCAPGGVCYLSSDEALHRSENLRHWTRVGTLPWLYVRAMDCPHPAVCVTLDHVSTDAGASWQALNPAKGAALGEGLHCFDAGDCLARMEHSILRFSPTTATQTRITGISPTSAQAGQTMDVAVSVASRSDEPFTGTVRINTNHDGQILCETTVTTGRCRFSVDHGGIYRLHAHFQGPGGFAPSTSEPWLLRVEPVEEMFILRDGFEPAENP